MVCATSLVVASFVLCPEAMTTASRCRRSKMQNNCVLMTLSKKGRSKGELDQISAVRHCLLDRLCQSSLKTKITVPTGQGSACSGGEAGNLCVGFLLACSSSQTLHFASLHRCYHINIPVTIAYCQTQFRKVPVCYKYFIVLEYAI